MIRAHLVPFVVAGVMSVTIDAHAIDARRVHWIGKVSSGRTLVVDESDGAHAVLSLPAWATIDDTVVSPSHEHALVYAQVHVGETRTVFVIDLVKRVVEGSYKPGVGGQFFFTAGDRVFQYWGCGTECAGVQVRSRSGTELLQTVCEGFDEDHELSSDRAIAVCFDESAISVLDLDRGKTLTRQRLPCAFGRRDDVKIDSKNGKVHFTCDDDRDRSFDVTVSFGATQGVRSRALR